MSIPSLQGLQTALSGLIAEQQALDTTGANIANSNTEGYSRERVVMSPNDPLEIPALSQITGQGGQLGTGVGVETIERIRNAYLDATYRTQNGNLSGAATQSEELQQAQSAVGEPSDTGIASQLSTFWTSWANLANAPTSESARESVIAAGQQLAGSLKQLSSQLSTIAGQAHEQYASLTGPSGEVQDYAGQIAQLNGQIRNAEQSGQNPNSMLDRRDLLLDKLSGLANVTVKQQPDGTDTVTFGNAAKPLVEGTTVNWPQPLTGAAGGQLGALLGLSEAGGALTSLQSSVNGVAANLISSVNALQPTKPFFSGTEAGNIAVAVTAPQIQASSGEAVGGNELALSIAGLRGGSTDQAWSALVEKVGSSVSAAKDAASNLQTVVGSINSQRQSVSGVSVDEEMTNLMSFQRGYQASARTLTVMDEMLETVIEHTGKVGL